MDYYTQATPHSMLSGVERRSSARKPMRQKVSIGSADHGIIRGQTRDISAGGLSVMIPVALAIDTWCAVRFELFVDGALVHFAGTGQVAHCVCSGMHGFRIGMSFKVQEQELVALLNKFLAS